MRIVDGNLNEIVYYGFHYPTNHHARRVVDLSYSSPPTFVSMVTGDDGMDVPQEFFMKLDIVDVDNGGCFDDKDSDDLADHDDDESDSHT